MKNLVLERSSMEILGELNKSDECLVFINSGCESMFAVLDKEEIQLVINHLTLLLKQ